MDNFYLKSTSKTPYVHFEAKTGELELTGRSIPENAMDFYKPILEWLDNYLEQNSLSSTRLHIRLEYFNTSSSKCLLELFKRIEVLSRKKINVKVLWYYETADEDMKELGEDFKEIIEVPVELIAVE